MNKIDPGGNITVSEKSVPDKKKRDKLYAAAEKAEGKLRKHHTELKNLAEILKRGERPKPFSPEAAALRRLETRLYGPGNVGLKEIEFETQRTQKNIDYIASKDTIVEVAPHPKGDTKVLGWVRGNLPDGTMRDGIVHITEKGLKQSLDALAETLVHEASHLVNRLSDSGGPNGKGLYGSWGAKIAMRQGVDSALRNNDNWVFSTAGWMPF